MFQLLCKNQSEEEVMDFINNICLKKDILLKYSNNNNDDVHMLSLFRSVLRYLIDKNEVDKALDIFIIIKDVEPFDIIGSIYYSELLIHQQSDIKFIHKGIKILNNIKEYISFVNIICSRKSYNNEIKSAVEKDTKFLSNELLTSLLKGNKQQDDFELESNNFNNRYEINIGFGQEHIEKSFKIIYQYMRANSKVHENFCNNISSQKYLLVCFHIILFLNYKKLL